VNFNYIAKKLIAILVEQIAGEKQPDNRVRRIYCEK